MYFDNHTFMEVLAGKKPAEVLKAHTVPSLNEMFNVPANE